MKFLVVLTAIIVAGIWKQDLDRIDDRWFFKLREAIERRKADKQKADKNAWFIVFLATYSVPLVLLALVLSLSAEVLFGLVTIVIHVFVLLMAFDRIHPGALARQFLNYWEEGDYEACYLFLEKELGCVDLPPVDNLEALHTTFNRLYVYRCFERMFVTLFWFLVAGPLGVLFAYVSYQLRYDVLTDSETPELEPVDGIIQLLEWLPLRLLGLTLGLVGNFENCISRLKRVGLAAEVNTAQAVYEYSLCALGRPDQQGASDTRSLSPAEQDSTDDYPSQAAGEIASLQNLMQRSQFVWLTVFALLVTVLGWQL